MIWETQKNPLLEKKSLDDSIKLAILETVEAEVQKRIKRQEWYYWIIIAVFAGVAAAFALTFWHHALNEIPDAVKNQLATEGALSAQKELTDILTNAQQTSSGLNVAFNSTKAHADEVNKKLNDFVTTVQTTADTVNSSLSQIPSSIDTNVIVPLGNRLEKLKQQDNILLVDDLPKLFVRELATNLVDNNTIILNYEPIASSVIIYGGSGIARIFFLENYGYCQGRGIILTNLTPVLTSQVLNHIQNGGVEIEYIRKSLH